MARADRVFTGLVLLALVSGALLLLLLATLLPHVERLAARGPVDVSDLVAVVLIGLAFCGIALGFGTLCRQVVATGLLIRRLVSRRVAAPWRVRDAATGLGLDGRIDVVADRHAFSFCYWFLRPRICVSTAMVERLGRDELRAVLLHERTHLRRRDPLRILVARYFAAGLYVVPVVEELLEYYALEKEIEADQAAVEAAGEVGPLARALYEVLPDADAVSLGLLVPVGALSVTEARIEHLVDGRALPLALSRASIVLSAGALAAAAVLALVHAVPGGPLAGPLPDAAGPGLVVAPASLLFAAAVSGAAHQLRLVARR